MTDGYVGQKVVCIVDRSFWRARSWANWWKRVRYGWRAPVKGRIYEVAGIIPRESLLGGLGFQLAGHCEDWLYAADGFRPLVSQNADLAVFHAILARLPARKRRLAAAERGRA